jgi:hypothetical protein
MIEVAAVLREQHGWAAGFVEAAAIASTEAT